MSYHCTLPQGHTETPPEDPEPCWAVESRRSARAWDAWATRQEQKIEVSRQTIECPNCRKVAMTVDFERALGTCENCGIEASFQHEQPAAVVAERDEEIIAAAKAFAEPEEHPGVHDTAYDPEVHTDALGIQVGGGNVEPTKQRDGDQVLPTGDESIPDDQALLIADIEARRQVGIERYGQGHRPFNGRDTLLDAYEEQLDFLVYLRSLRRMAEATREDLIREVSKSINDEFSGMDVRTWSESGYRIAEVAVDRIMGWVVGTHLDRKPTGGSRVDRITLVLEQAEDIGGHTHRQIAETIDRLFSDTPEPDVSHNGPITDISIPRGHGLTITPDIPNSNTTQEPTDG